MGVACTRVALHFAVTPGDDIAAEIAGTADPAVALSVVIPMYREARRIEATLRDVIEWLSAWDKTSEIILVDDGSSDDTVAVVTPFVGRASSDSTERLRRIELVRHGVNRGKGAAVRTGLAEARGAWRLMMDADNSARVREVVRLWPSNDAVVLAAGSRNVADSHVKAKPTRKIAGLIFRLCLKTLGLALLRDTQCGFKLYRADLANLIARVGAEDRFAFDLEHLLLAKRFAGRGRAGEAITEVGVEWEHKDGGTVRPIRDGLKMLARAVAIRSRFTRDPKLARSELELKPSRAEKASGV